MPRAELFDPLCSDCADLYFDKWVGSCNPVSLIQAIAKEATKVQKQGKIIETLRGVLNREAAEDATFEAQEIQA